MCYVIIYINYKTCILAPEIAPSIDWPIEPGTRILHKQLLETSMTVCPIAVVVGCQKCPAFSVCPLKTVLGDQPKPGASGSPPEAAEKN